MGQTRGASGSVCCPRYLRELSLQEVVQLVAHLPRNHKVVGSILGSNGSAHE